MKDSNAIVRLNASENACQLCKVKNSCLLSVLDKSDRKAFSKITIHNKLLRHDEHLFFPGDPFHYVYIIHSGSFKTYIAGKDGDTQVTGFHFQGDVLGLDGFFGGIHDYGADSLETSTVCKIPLIDFEKIMNQHVALSHASINVMSREIILNQKLLLILGRMTAEQKVANFLIHISEEYEARGHSPITFNLTMKRSEIANYLALANETVSRMFRTFQDRGIIHVERRNVSINNFSALKSSVGLTNNESTINAAYSIHKYK